MYICIENGIVVAALTYPPAVPDTVEIVETTAEDDAKVAAQTHFFDVESRTVKPLPSAELDKKEQEKVNADFREFLNSTDWKVLRHIREKSLGLATTLTEEEYVDLENQRQNAANSIIN